MNAQWCACTRIIFKAALVVPMMLVLLVAIPALAQGVDPQAQYQNLVLGVSLNYPSALKIVEPQYRFLTHGFTVVDSEKRSVLSVAWLYQATAQQLQSEVQKVLKEFPGIPIQQSTIQVDGHPAVTLSGVPGMTGATYIFVAANGRLYQITYGKEALDTLGQTLLNNLHFVAATRSLESLGLRKAEDVLRDSTPRGREVPVIKLPPPSSSMNTQPVQPLAVPGCVDYPTTKFLATPWGPNANGPGTGWAAGWSQAGPSYYGEGLHVNCNRPDRQNDYYALDFPLKVWDVVYPTGAGRVIYAGWSSGGWAGLGRVVIIDLGDNYKSLHAHLRSISVSVGAYVEVADRIGTSGGSGYGRDGSWGTHLHQGLYYNATLSNQGGTYGGQSAQPIRVYHFGNGAGYYNGISNRQLLSW